MLQLMASVQVTSVLTLNDSDVEADVVCSGIRFSGKEKSLRYIWLWTELDVAADGVSSEVQIDLDHHGVAEVDVEADVVCSGDINADVMFRLIDPG
ncbi:Tight Junction Protein Zo-3 [Manis pentadactyla]|nr:Tight Junction Protein Zo-3 [Manis pentadactyla]